MDDKDWRVLWGRVLWVPCLILNVLMHAVSRVRSWVEVRARVGVVEDLDQGAEDALKVDLCCGGVYCLVCLV